MTIKHSLPPVPEIGWICNCDWDDGKGNDCLRPVLIMQIIPGEKAKTYVIAIYGTSKKLDRIYPNDLVAKKTDHPGMNLAKDTKFVFDQFTYFEWSSNRFGRNGIGRNAYRGSASPEWMQEADQKYKNAIASTKQRQRTASINPPLPSNTDVSSEA